MTTTYLDPALLTPSDYKAAADVLREANGHLRLAVALTRKAKGKIECTKPAIRLSLKADHLKSLVDDLSEIISELEEEKGPMQN